MNTTINFKQIIKQGDSNTVSLLPSEASSHLIAETMVALANSSGGQLILGINNQKILGVGDAEQIRDQILEAVLTLTPTFVVSLPKIIKVDEKTLVIAEVPSGLPHVYAYEGRYLERKNNDNVPIPPNELRQLMIMRGEFSYESEVAQNSNLDDIDWIQVEAYIKRLNGISNYTAQEILHQRGCLIRKEDKLIPTHAGILLFGKMPQQFIRSSEITAVRFAGDTMGDTFNRQDIIGTLPQQIQRAETFLIDHLRKSVTLKETMQRKEDYEYPMEAVRELVVNAVAHRDYSIQGDNIRLFMYNNHMEVHSPGSLPGPMTLDNLKEERFSRNPIIVQFLSDMGYIERLGYGVDRVIELMQSQGYEAPKFINNANGFKVTLTKNLNSIAVKTENPQSPTTIHFNGVYQGQEINPRQESALVYLHQQSNSRITNSDLKGMFPDVHPETIRRDLVDLVNKNILKKMGQKRGSYYVLVESTLKNET